MDKLYDNINQVWFISIVSVCFVMCVVCVYRNFCVDNRRPPLLDVV